jgi:hypothetical protein
VAVFQAQRIVLGRGITQALLDALSTVPTAALAATPKMRLSHDPAFAPISTSLPSELAAEEAMYTGYTAGGLAVLFGTPLNLSPSIQGITASITFEVGATAPTTPDSIYGYWIETTTELVCAEAFPTGLVFGMAAPGDYLTIVCAFALGLYQDAQ